MNLEITEATVFKVIEDDSISSSDNPYPRPFANQRLNSRLPYPFTEKRWEVKWQKQIRPLFNYNFILTLTDYFLLQSAGIWLLCDKDGNILLNENYGNSDIIFIEEDSLFYFADKFGRINAVNIPKGNIEYTLPINGMEDHKRVYINKENGYLLVTSHAKSQNPHHPNSYSFARIESNMIQKPYTVESGILFSVKNVKDISFACNSVLSVSSADKLITAIDNKILITDFDLNTKYEYNGKFYPVSMSTDDSGRIYLTVITDGTRNAFWIIDTDGKLILDHTIELDTPEKFLPPIIGFDHTVFLVSANNVFAFDKVGTFLWNTRTAGKVGGAVVSSNNYLLLTEGKMVTAFNYTGERKFIFHFENEEVTTQPLLMPNGDIYLATTNNIYCLSIVK